ncbi:MAG: sensor histidine kinase [Bacteroidota bacterium]
MSEELSRLYEELVRSYQELESTNIKPLEPKVFATIDRSGKFIGFHDIFRRLIECEQDNEPQSFQQLLLENHYSEEFVHGLIDRVNEGNNWSGELKLTNESGDFCWLEVFIIPLINEENSQATGHKIIARDITDLKEAKLRSSEINRAKIEERVKEQQYRSVLILEGQEEERKRLGRDIHDGIGQMLSALKLSLESITPSSSIHTKKRLEDTKDLMKSIIKETRRVSFNLTPTNLSDFGIIPAVKRFCQGVNALSEAEIIFENKTRFINRLENHIENNVYRIVQEAVNNAIKYAKAKTISVTFEHEHKELLITIKDDGRGFDYNEKANTPNLKSSGLGLFNMRERSAFINAKFELNSVRGQGTNIKVKIPIS